MAESQDAADVIVTNAEFFTHETMHLVRPKRAEGRIAYPGLLFYHTVQQFTLTQINK